MGLTALPCSYDFGGKDAVFVRKVGKHLMVPMGDDWITLKHYLRLLDHGAVRNLQHT